MSSAYKGILRLEDVSFSYGADDFISGLGISFDESEFVGLLGANGSGKSTLMRLMGGMIRPSAGSVELWGRSMGDYRNRDRAKLVSYLPQSLDASVPFTVGQLAAMGLYPYERPTGMSLDEALATVGLSHKRNESLARLSGGERRRAYIAMTLTQGAGIVLLDEPLANLDIRYQMELIRLLRRLNGERAMTLVMALHEINLALLFDRVVLVKEGRVLADGPPQDVMGRADLMAEAFGMRLELVGNGAEGYFRYGEIIRD